MRFLFPAIVFYTDKLPEGTGGCANAFIVRIRPKYRDTDEGIHEHELYHVKSFFAETFISLIVLAALSFLILPDPPWTWAALPFCLCAHSIIYLIPKFRELEETAAYKTQLRYPPAIDDRAYYSSLYAKFISEDYGLKISQEEALELLE